ncbi:MAG TPA: FtsX-like permease family protein, partial [Bacteroidales bacterium]
GRNKLYAAITILGFSISLVFVILLSAYVKKEYSVDRFQINKNRIYRLVHDSYSGFAPPTGPLLAEKFPDVACYTRIFNAEGFTSGMNDEKFSISYLMADSAFFSMFSFQLLEGRPETVLKDKKSIVLSRSYALALFGKIPKLGELVKLDDRMEYRLSGIMADWPENTHFQKIDAIVDFPSLADKWGYPQLLTTYDNNSFGLYIMAKPNTDISSKAMAMLQLFKDVNWMYKEKSATEVVLEPLTDVYFGKSISPGIKQNNKTWIKVLSAIAVLILLLSVINYINLTIAQSGFRSRETAIRKLMGGKRSSFLLQYVSESILLCLFSFLIALLISFESEPIFNYLLNTKLDFAKALHPLFFGYAVFIIVFIGTIAGIIPALKISAFRPVEVVKGSFRMKEKSIYSRILILFQYMLIISLLISTLFIDKQTRFLRNYDLGFKKDHVIWIDNTLQPDKLKTFKAILENIPGVTHVCCVRGTPLNGGNNNTFKYNGKLISFQTFEIDTSFFRMMGMEVHQTGAALSENMVWLNEAAAKAMELPDNPVTARIYDRDLPVYGIVKDFHFRDLRQTIGPAYFQVMNPNFWAWNILIKISDKNVTATVHKIRSEYRQFTHGLPMTMGFMDESINRWYEQEEKTGKMIGYFTILAIIISVMGLFAMSLYYVQQKVKEIGIRKVNGARVTEILTMLHKDFIKWVVVAFVIACPVAWYAMNKWLQNFAYKTELSWWVFVLAGAVAVTAALLTISWQSWRAATRNPVESLRYE